MPQLPASRDVFSGKYVRIAGAFEGSIPRVSKMPCARICLKILASLQPVAGCVPLWNRHTGCSAGSAALASHSNALVEAGPGYVREWTQVCFFDFPMNRGAGVESLKGMLE
jgi:hypothetical protein